MKSSSELKSSLMAACGIKEVDRPTDKVACACALIRLHLLYPLPLHNLWHGAFSAVA